MTPSHIGTSIPQTPMTLAPVESVEGSPRVMAPTRRPVQATPKPIRSTFHLKKELDRSVKTLVTSATRAHVRRWQGGRELAGRYWVAGVTSEGDSRRPARSA